MAFLGKPTNNLKIICRRVGDGDGDETHGGLAQLLGSLQQTTGLDRIFLYKN